MCINKCCLVLFFFTWKWHLNIICAIDIHTTTIYALKVYAVSSWESGVLYDMRLSEFRMKFPFSIQVIHLLTTLCFWHDIEHRSEWNGKRGERTILWNRTFAYWFEDDAKLRMHFHFPTPTCSDISHQFTQNRHGKPVENIFRISEMKITFDLTRKLFNFVRC